MLRYTARVLGILLKARLAPPASISVQHRRVRLSQCDFNRHMNQAAYASVAEEGRTELVLRNGLWAHLRGRGILPVVANQEIVYRRELKPFQAFTLDTRATAVEGRLLRVESHLIVGERVHATVVARLIFIGPDGVLDGEAARAQVQGFLADPLAVEDWRVVR